METGCLRSSYSEPECYDTGMPRCDGGPKRGTQPSLGNQGQFPGGDVQGES